MAGMTRPRHDLELVRAFLAEGLSVAAASRRAGIPRSTVRTWLAEGIDRRLERRVARPPTGDPCELCHYLRNLSEQPYAYLLGLYLGDGSIASHARGVYRLRIIQDQRYVNLINECSLAMHSVIPNRVGLLQRQGCREISSYSKHWPCLLPQHGVGPKHERRILLEPWQHQVALERHPHLLLRGLVHSDGCRYENRVGKKYSYTSYGFTNRSDDIRELFMEACARLDIRCRQGSRWQLAVTRRDDVEKMDRFIGPKS